MMYSRADKIRIFRKLQNPQMGECDLRLLAHQAPQHPDLAKFRRNPMRYADDILYALIDVTTEQTITQNRSQEQEAAPKPSPRPVHRATGAVSVPKTTKKKPSKKKTSTRASTGRT